jgi:hypothetical protein
MLLRLPHVAGMFYPESPDECRAELDRCLAAAAPGGDLPERPSAAVVPHAGWRFSGVVCARAMRALAERRTPDTVVIFGADHRAPSRVPAVFPAGAWRTPLGEIKVDTDLAAGLTAIDDELDVEPARHTIEHSIEVVVPFVQRLFDPAVRILPILVPPSAGSCAVGEAVAAAAGRLNRDVVFVGSTDLTHYGPGYGFTPMGEGPAALRWAKDVNDRRLIDLMLAVDAEAVVGQVHAHTNACGPGAIAATLAAARRSGATGGVLLDHVTSAEVFPERGSPQRCVGYAGLLF